MVTGDVSYPQEERSSAIEEIRAKLANVYPSTMYEVPNVNPTRPIPSVLRYQEELLGKLRDRVSGLKDRMELVMMRPGDGIMLGENAVEMDECGEFLSQLKCNNSAIELVIEEIADIMQRLEL